MGFEKAEIIKAVLDEQASDAEKKSEACRREASEHNGAEQALMQLGKQMPNFADVIEKRLEADTEMSPGEATAVRTYTKNIIARFQTMCVDNAKNQRNCKLRSEGQISMLEDMAKNLRKKGEVALATAKRRAEVDAENRATKNAEEAASKKAAEAIEKAKKKSKKRMPKVVTKPLKTPAKKIGRKTTKKA